MAVWYRCNCTRMQHVGGMPSVPRWLKERAASAPSSLDAAPLRPIPASAHLRGATRLLAPPHQQDKREGERERGDEATAPWPGTRSQGPSTTVEEEPGGGSGRPLGPTRRKKRRATELPSTAGALFRPGGMLSGSLASSRRWWPPSVLGRHLVGSDRPKEAGHAAAQGEGEAGGRRNRKEEKEEKEEEKKRKRWEEGREKAANSGRHWAGRRRSGIRSRKGRWQR